MRLWVKWQHHPDFLALLRRVLAAPEDAAPRSVLSDWLRDHGDDPSADAMLPGGRPFVAGLTPEEMRGLRRDLVDAEFFYRFRHTCGLHRHTRGMAPWAAEEWEDENCDCLPLPKAEHLAAVLADHGLTIPLRPSEPRVVADRILTDIQGLVADRAAGMEPAKAGEYVKSYWHPQQLVRISRELTRRHPGKGWNRGDRSKPWPADLLIRLMDWPARQPKPAWRPTRCRRPW